MLQTKGVIGQEQLDHYIEEAAKAAGYGERFGLQGCDLTKTIWWAAYIRQSLEEQAQNNRLPDYLRTCAQEAKKLGVVVPKEFILYDAVTGKHLERPNMIRLRKLMLDRQITGVIFPALDRLSREPIHIGIFEFQAQYVGVRVHYTGAPNGSDPMSQMVRMNIASAAKFVKLANRKNAVGGNIGRVVKGLVPAHRAAYGYRYCRDAEGGKWSPSRVAKVVHRHCYTGEHAYNVNVRVPNPERPLGDITAEVKRTLVRPKPEEEWVYYKVPALVSKEVWQKANTDIAERGRGRGKQGKSLQALLRGRIFCPKCGKPMVVRRGGRSNHVYYHCSRYYQPWVKEPCNYRRFIPSTWEDLVWQDICAWLRDDAWVEQQLTSEKSQNENTNKLIRLQQFKITHVQAKIAKVQEGFEGGIYNLDEARRRITDYQETIARTEGEIQQLRESFRPSAYGKADIEAMREELKALRDRKLDEATFEDKLEIVSNLGIKVYPAEDLKSMRVTCQLNLKQEHQDGQSVKTANTDLVRSQANGETELAIRCRKVHIGPP